MGYSPFDCVFAMFVNIKPLGLYMSRNLRQQSAGPIDLQRILNAGIKNERLPIPSADTVHAGAILIGCSEEVKVKGGGRSGEAAGRDGEDLPGGLSRRAKVQPIGGPQ